MTHLEKFSRTVNTGVEAVVAVLAATMAAVVAAQVFSRYVLNHSLFWSEELARVLLVWLTFLGATVAYHRRANPGVDILVRRLGGAARRGCAAVVHGASLVLFAVMIGFGFQFAHFVRSQVTPALGLEKWIPHAIVPVSGAILALHALAFLLREVVRRDG